jgi:phosphoribosylaminoimidazolecarboxamide formyltransferase/IMP cyclohydrolase
MSKIFLEVIIAKGFDKNALKILRLKKNVRLIDSSNLIFKELFKFNSIDNFTLVQSEDNKSFSRKNFEIVSKKRPNKSQFENLIFAFNMCRYVKSNAIVIVSNKSTVGIGSGQPSRLDSCETAINKMNKFINPKNEIVAASDAFFPFTDGIEKLVQSGINAVIQPAGSIRDKEIIKFVNDTDTILVFSKTRHFRH